MEFKQVFNNQGYKSELHSHECDNNLKHVPTSIALVAMCDLMCGHYVTTIIYSICGQIIVIFKYSNNENKLINVLLNKKCYHHDI